MKLYAEISSKIDNDKKCDVPLETLIVLFAQKCCLSSPLKLVLYECKSDQPTYTIDLTSFDYELLIGIIPNPANLCKLPVITLNENTTCIAGLCAVVRQIYISASSTHPLLGFKQSCLYACAEVSLWTKFCEIDLISCVKNCGKEPIVPNDVARFEGHLAQPVRAHNIQKVKQKASGSQKCSIPDARLQIAAELAHEYAEGAEMSIADVIIFPCLHLILSRLSGPGLDKRIPLVFAWYRKMMKVPEISDTVAIIGEIEQLFASLVYVEYLVPAIPDESLYKSDPRRYKPRHRIFTKPEDVEASLQAVEHLKWDMIQYGPLGGDIPFDWDSVPWDAQPVGGELPEKRAARKAQQLEGMTRAVLSIARHGDTIVDFCAGSGHLGLILAHSLPTCTVILLENKEQSLSRARARAYTLRLSNILFCQSNVDYFRGNLTIGVSLHACGVATDLVIQTCLDRQAAFVCCPCCYGSVQPNHMVQYPRSRLLQELPLSERQYLVLGHAADQTHDENNAKTAQGLECMNVIDGDRCVHAQELGYRVLLSKLHPLTCTPKNNLLVGVPPGRQL